MSEKNDADYNKTDYMARLAELLKGENEAETQWRARHLVEYFESKARKETYLDAPSVARSLCEEEVGLEKLIEIDGEMCERERMYIENGNEWC